MRIETIKPQPTPEVAKIAENSGAAKAGNDENRLHHNGSFSGDYPVSAKSQAAKEHEKTRVKMPGSNKIQYKINQDPRLVITQIVDSNSKEVVEEIPPEHLVEMIDTLNKVFSGNVDKKA